MEYGRIVDISRENAALIGLLTRGPIMRWAPLRDQLATGDMLPTDLVEDESEIQRGASVLEDWIDRACGAAFYTYLDAGFPPQLSSVWDFPPFVFIKGDEAPLRREEGDLGVCIVGSRRPHESAIAAAESISRGLIAENVTIVSGLAEGVDQAAHRTALEMQARTVGVIGTGIDRYYPKSSASLQREMESGRGMVISQFMPGASPTRYSFPMRNSTMSAYGTSTIIVEASEKSGTRHQASQAVKHGRPLILLSQVARQTTWGRALAEDPLTDVQVAHTPQEAVDMAFDVLERDVKSEYLVRPA